MYIYDSCIIILIYDTRNEEMSNYNFTTVSNYGFVNCSFLFTSKSIEDAKLIYLYF